jgi:hypothetical protein
VYPALTTNFKKSIGINCEVVDKESLIRQELRKLGEKDRVGATDEE